MTADDKTKSVLLLDGQTESSLLEDILKYETTEEWWRARICNKVIPAAVLETLALAVIGSVLVYYHNWIAVLFCMGIIYYKIINTVTTLTVSLTYAFLLKKVELAYTAGYNAEKSENSSPEDSGRENNVN